MRARIALLGHLYLCSYYFPLSRRLVARFSQRRAGSFGFVVKKKWHWKRFLSEYFDSIFAYKHRATNSAYSFDSPLIEFSRGPQFVFTYKHSFNILKNSHDISRFSSYPTENTVRPLERLVS